MSRLRICESLFQKQTSALKKKRSNFCGIGSRWSLNLEKKGLSQSKSLEKRERQKCERSEKKKVPLSADIFRPPFHISRAGLKSLKNYFLFSFGVTVDLACLFSSEVFIFLMFMRRRRNCLFCWDNLLCLNVQCIGFFYFFFGLFRKV